MTYPYVRSETHYECSLMLSFKLVIQQELTYII